MDSNVYSSDPMVLVNTMDSYFKSTPPDCSIFSQDDYGILIHRELFYQTKFMRDMVDSINADSKIEMICPSLSKEELKIIVDFLYNGKILNRNEKTVSQASKNLQELFGFPLIQYGTYKNRESEQDIKVKNELTVKQENYSDPLDSTKDQIEDEFENFESRSSIQRYHIQSDHEVKIKSEFIMDQESGCYDSFDYDNTENIGYICEFCNHSCGTQEGIRKHKKRVHKDYETGNEYVCEFCNHSCGTKEGIRQHTKRVHEGREHTKREVHEGKNVATLYCSLCKEDLKDISSLVHHMQMVHDKKKYPCDICDKMFGRNGRLKIHMKIKHNIIVVQKKHSSHKKDKCEKKEKETRDNNGKGKVAVVKRCPECKQTFESMILLIQHVETVHPDRKIYDCQFCKLQYLSVKRLAVHLSKKHSDQNSDGKCLLPNQDFKGSHKMCPICKELFHSRTLMMKHYTSKHPEGKIYDCLVCNEQYLSLNGLNTHMFSSHERKTNELGCSYCGRDFDSKDELKNHILTDHKDKKYKCSMCDVSTRSQIGLLNHIESVHEGKRHQCPTCGEVVETISKLESHVALKHDRTKLFECPSCDLTYVKKRSLDNHIAFVHDQSTGHLCPHCGKKFQYKEKLHDHVLVVHEGKKYSCDLCTMTFNRKPSLQSHIKKIHKGEKPPPVQCPQCERFFNSNGVVKRHIRDVHEKKRAFACPLCDLRFAQNAQLKTHIKGKHKNVHS